MKCICNNTSKLNEHFAELIVFDAYLCINLCLCDDSVIEAVAMVVLNETIFLLQFGFCLIGIQVLSFMIVICLVVYTISIGVTGFAHLLNLMLGPCVISAGFFSCYGISIYVHRWVSIKLSSRR